MSALTNLTSEADFPEAVDQNYPDGLTSGKEVTAPQNVSITHDNGMLKVNRKLFWLCVGLLLFIVIGGVIGGAVGGTQAHKSKPLSSVATKSMTTTQATATSTSSTTTPLPTIDLTIGAIASSFYNITYNSNENPTQVFYQDKSSHTIIYRLYDPSSNWTAPAVLPLSSAASPNTSLAIFSDVRKDTIGKFSVSLFYITINGTINLASLSCNSSCVIQSETPIAAASGTYGGSVGVYPATGLACVQIFDGSNNGVGWQLYYQDNNSDIFQVVFPGLSFSKLGHANLGTAIAATYERSGNASTVFVANNINTTGPGVYTGLSDSINGEPQIANLTFTDQYHWRPLSAIAAVQGTGESTPDVRFYYIGTDDDFYEAEFWSGGWLPAYTSFGGGITTPDGDSFAGVVTGALTAIGWAEDNVRIYGVYDGLLRERRLVENGWSEHIIGS